MRGVTTKESLIFKTRFIILTNVIDIHENNHKIHEFERQAAWQAALVRRLSVRFRPKRRQSEKRALGYGGKFVCYSTQGDLFLWVRVKDIVLPR